MIGDVLYRLYAPTTNVMMLRDDALWKYQFYHATPHHISDAQVERNILLSGIWTHIAQIKILDYLWLLFNKYPPLLGSRTGY